MKIALFVLCPLLFLFGFGFGFSTKVEPKTKISFDYRYFGDKKKPDTWLRKYSIPTAYYVWDYDVNHYVEVTKEKYDLTPSEDTK